VPEVSLPVSVMVVGDLVYPKSITLSKRDGKFSNREITITSRSKKNVKIKKVEDPSGKLKLTVKTSSGKAAVINAEVADTNVEYKEPFRSSFKIYTTSQNEPVLDIKFFIMDRAFRHKMRPSARFTPSKAQLSLTPPPTGSIEKPPGTKKEEVKK